MVSNSVSVIRCRSVAMGAVDRVSFAFDLGPARAPVEEGQTRPAG
jgi:hypothetical protein